MCIKHHQYQLTFWQVKVLINISKSNIFIARELKKRRILVKLSRRLRCIPKGILKRDKETKNAK